MRSPGRPGWAEPGSPRHGRPEPGVVLLPASYGVAQPRLGIRVQDIFDEYPYVMKVIMEEMRNIIKYIYNLMGA